MLIKSLFWRTYFFIIILFCLLLVFASHVSAVTGDIYGACTYSGPSSLARTLTQSDCSNAPSIYSIICSVMPGNPANCADGTYTKSGWYPSTCGVTSVTANAFGSVPNCLSNTFGFYGGQTPQQCSQDISLTSRSYSGSVVNDFCYCDGNTYKISDGGFCCSNLQAGFQFQSSGNCAVNGYLSTCATCDSSPNGCVCDAGCVYAGYSGTGHATCGGSSPIICSDCTSKFTSVCTCKSTCSKAGTAILTGDDCGGPKCGDGKKDPGEQCDDGSNNGVGNDLCNSHCQYTCNNYIPPFTTYKSMSFFASVNTQHCLSQTCVNNNVLGHVNSSVILIDATTPISGSGCYCVGTQDPGYASVGVSGSAGCTETPQNYYCPYGTSGGSACDGFYGWRSSSTRSTLTSCASGGSTSADPLIYNNIDISTHQESFDAVPSNNLINDFSVSLKHYESFSAVNPNSNCPTGTNAYCSSAATCGNTCSADPIQCQLLSVCKMPILPVCDGTCYASQQGYGVILNSVYYKCGVSDGVCPDDFSNSSTCGTSTGICISHNITDSDCVAGCTANNQCTNFPPTACNGNSVRTYSSLCTISGTSGICSYPYTDTPCGSSATCQNGACIPLPSIPANPCTILNSTLIPTPNGGCVGNSCKAGDNLTVTITYTGNCNTATFAQMDAYTMDGSCKIQYSGYNMKGIFYDYGNGGFFTNVP